MSTTEAQARSEIERALAIAFEAHKNDWRKGANALPYMAHIFDIMKFAQSLGIPIKDYPVYQAIILHDAVESGMPLAVIESAIPSIAPIVAELTFLGTKEGKPGYLASFSGKSVVSLTVKAMDRICNVWDFYAEGDKRYALKYLRMADALWDAVYARRREIEDRWGSRAWDDLSESYEKVMGVMESSNRRYE